VVWASEVKQDAQGDAETEDDVGKVADEQVAVGEEVGDVTAAKLGRGEQPVQQVADRASPHQADRDRPPDGAGAGCGDE